MSELSRLISRLQRGIVRNASYIRSIRHPQLLVASLQELEGIVGNDKIKDAVATQISHLIMVKRRALENSNVKEDEVMLNTVLYGPPGTAKTTVGTKLAKIWYSLGYLDGSRNSKEKKHELGDMIKDIFRDGSTGTTTTDDTTITLFILFIFIIVFVTLLSMAWSFYTRFGGMWTAIIISLVFLIIIMVGYYISYSLNSSNNNNKSNTNNVKSSQNSQKGSNNQNNLTGQNNINNTGSVHNRTDNNEFGNSPVLEHMPSDDEIIKIVTRADFVDKYVGWSDKKTIKLLEENLGKVLFVDEAYSLVTDMHDSFGMEVLTAINLFLSQHSNEIIVIFAGYKDLMEAGIFSFQPGLRRRFMWQFDCNGYTSEQLFDIFKLQLNKKGWGLTDEESTKSLFRQNSDAFPSFGGDTERLTFFSELEHSRDFIANEKGMSINKLTPDHVRRGILKLRENNIQSDPNEESQNPMANMMKLFSNKKNSKPKLPTYNEQNNALYSDRSEVMSNDLDIINAIRNTAPDRAFY